MSKILHLIMHTRCIIRPIIYIIASNNVFPESPDYFLCIMVISCVKTRNFKYNKEGTIDSLF